VTRKSSPHFQLFFVNIGAGLPDGLFSIEKIPIWANCKALQNLPKLGFFVTIWSILGPLKIFYVNMVYFVVIWYISPRFGILYQEKSGNPAL
jgi:hypothetical protein